MNRFTKTLAGFGLALGLLALPLGAGAAEEHSNTIPGNEVVQPVRYDPMAYYGILDITDLEQIAGRENLDQRTIQFLEWNVWDYAEFAQPAGDRDEPLTLTDYLFLEDNIWGNPALLPHGEIGEAY